MKRYHIRTFSPVWWLGCGVAGLAVFYGAIGLAMLTLAAIGG